MLIKLTEDFTREDYFKYRKDRDWKKYDASTPLERLFIIMREIKEYKNGYFDDDYSSENNNSEPSGDEYY